jgi:peroxiredoxin
MSIGFSLAEWCRRLPMLLLAATLMSGVVVLSGCKKAESPVANTPDPALNKPTGPSPDLRQVNPYEFLAMIPEGGKAPAFQIKAVGGEVVDSAKIPGQYLVMVFFQGSFCPVCGHQLETYQQHLDTLKKLGAAVVAISHDDAKDSMKTVAEHGLTFPVIADPKQDLIKTYGVANVVKSGLAYPTVYVLDKSGTVRLAYAHPDGERLEAPKLIQFLKTGNRNILNVK